MKAVKRFLVFCLVTIIGYFGGKYAYYNRWTIKEYFFPTTYKSYKEFNIRIPTQYKTHGIDVSHHNGAVNWELVSKMQVDSIALDFAFIKATEGTSHVDKRFHFNWKNIAKTRLIRGAYHYFSPNKSGLDQANHFIEHVKLIKGDLAPVVDVEVTGGVTTKKMIEELTVFIKKLEAHYNVEPIVYTYHDFYKLHLKGAFDDYPLWIAHYHVSKPNNQFWNFWQHSDKGHVHGINGKVDFNVFNREVIDLKHYCIK